MERTARGGPAGGTEPTLTIFSLVAEAERELAACGIPAARLEAEVLLAHRLSVDRGALLTRGVSGVDPATLAGYREDLSKRAARYPLQYITGIQEFYSLTMEVDERVLIPRPETEMIVEEVIRTVREDSAKCGAEESAGILAGRQARAVCNPVLAGPVIVDVGTGSGCIAVALAANLPSSEILASDISDDALEVARANASRHAVGGRVRFAQGDALAPAFAAGLAGQVDFLVSNPPYIAEADMTGLQAELGFEPRIALSPGPEGLALTRRLIEGADRLLKPGGWLLMELSVGRSIEAMALLRRELWDSVETKADLQGIPRLLKARRREPSI